MCVSKPAQAAREPEATQGSRRADVGAEGVGEEGAGRVCVADGTYEKMHRLAPSHRYQARPARHPVNCLNPCPPSFSKAGQVGSGQVGMPPQTMDGQMGAPVRSSRFGAVGLQLPPPAVWPTVLDYSGFVQPGSHVSMALAGGSPHPHAIPAKPGRGEFVSADERRAGAARGSTIRAAGPPGTNHAVGDQGASLLGKGARLRGRSADGPVPFPMGEQRRGRRCEPGQPVSRFLGGCPGRPALAANRQHSRLRRRRRKKTIPGPEKKNVGGENPDRWGQSPSLRPPSSDSTLM